MRDDLLDADTCVDWAISQIQFAQDAFNSWIDARPYVIDIKRNPQTGIDHVFAQSAGLFSAMPNVQTGMIINGLRSSLDLLAASLARRNGVKPSTETHFPIFRCIMDFIDPLTGIEGKKWLSKSEIAAIKSLKPYGGGDETLWPLHQLDIMRKHYQLIAVGARLRNYRPGIPPAWIRFDDEADLGPLPLGMSPETAESDTDLALEITFDEPTIGLANRPVVPTLRLFAARCREIIALFA